MIDVERFRKLIVERIATLENSAGQSDSEIRKVELDQTRVGRLSRMDALQMQQMELALDRRQQTEIAGLREALIRVDQDGFGECLECGGEINPRRLEIDPAATLCIDCASANEAGS